jgi:hypothetical protein
MKQSCEKLTSIIQDLQTLQKRVDSATNSFDSEKGLLAKDEAMKTLEPYRLRSLFKKESFDYFVKVFDGEKELKEKIVHFTTTGKSGNQLKSELEQAEFNSQKVHIFNDAGFMLQSPEFQAVKANEKIPTIRLQVRELFSDENDHTYAEILARSSELGLGFLPHEAAADLLLDEKTQPRMNENHRIISEPILTRSDSPYVFCLEHHDNRLWFDVYWAYATYGSGSDAEFVFRLGKSET